MKKFKTILVGLGKIGVGYDLEAPAGSYFSHARSLLEHPSFDLLGGIEPDALMRQRFAEAYHLPTAADPASAPASFRAAAGLVIAAPTRQHVETLRAMREWRPEFILLEKPMGENAIDASECVKIAESMGARLYVNYIRRGDPGVRAVQSRIGSGDFGIFRRGVISYNGTLRNSGCHFINLLEFWLGSPSGSHLLSCEGTPAPSFCLNFGSAPVHVFAGPHDNFSVGEIELWFSGGLLRYERGGEAISWRPAIVDAAFPSERSLAADPELIRGGMRTYQLNVYNVLSLCLYGNEASGLECASALNTSLLIDQILGAPEGIR